MNAASVLAEKVRKRSDLFDAAPQLIDTQLKKLAQANEGRFSPDQASSLVEMMNKVAAADGDLTASQRDFIEGIRSAFIREKQSQGKWS